MRLPFLALLVASAFVSGGPLPAESNRPLERRSTREDADLVLTAARIRGEASTRRTQIYRILRGGLANLDPEVQQHLWDVAGSLAEGEWSPPRVIIHAVDHD